MQVKTVLCTTYVNNVQKCCRLLWAHLKWTDAQWKCVLLFDKSTFQIVYENICIVFSGPKTKSTIQIVAKVKQKKSRNVMACLVNMSNFICEETTNTEHILEQHFYAVFTRTPMFISIRQWQTTFCMCYNSMAVIKECGYKKPWTPLLGPGHLRGAPKEFLIIKCSRI